MRLNYVIVFVSDMDRSIAFYEKTLGLALRFRSPNWTEFATDGPTLALHPTTDPAAPAPLTAETPGHCRFGFAVPDLAAFHTQMTERGVPCVEQPRVVAGSRVAQYADPDGLAFSVGEART